MPVPDTFTRPPKDAAPEPWTRARVISALAAARAEFLDAIAGFTPRTAERTMSPGRWNARLTVLHLVARDRARIAEWDAALAGQRASWQSFGPTEYAALNTQELGALGGTSWDQALALLDSTRRDLQEKIALVPEEPLTVWQPSHPFGWMMEALHHHDRHHAAAVRRWRQGVGV